MKTKFIRFPVIVAWTKNGSCTFIPFFMIFILLLSFARNGFSQSGYDRDYQTALDAFNTGKYDRALVRFQALLSRSKDDALADNAQYWIGECYYGMKDYNKALIEFEKVFTFPKSNKKDDAQLKIGLCYIRLDDKENAQRELTRLLSKFPDSEFTTLGRKLLREL